MTIKKKSTNLNKRANSIGKLYRLFEDDLWGHFFFKNVNFIVRYKFLLKSTNLYYKNMREIWDLIKQRKMPWLRKRNFVRLSRLIFRLNIIRRFKRRRKRSKISIAALDAKKFKVFYNISVSKIKKLIKNSFDITFGSKYWFFLWQLETRLDVMIYRLHFVTTVGQARQLINHGKITVNGKIINRQSYSVKTHDVISCIFDVRYLILSNILRRMLPVVRSELFYYYPIYYEVNYRILSAKVVYLTKPFKESWIPFFGKKSYEFLRAGFAFFTYRKRFF